MIAVVETVRAKAAAVGAAGWLDELPGIVAGLEREWSITVGRPYADATEAFVAEAWQADGTPAVLKVMMPRASDVARQEITVLELTRGEGCVRLLRADVTQGAMLLERLGRSLYELRLPVRRRHEILCDVAQRVWRPASGVDLPTGAEKAEWLGSCVTSLWESLRRPCSREAIANARDCAESRAAAHSPSRALLVHGDVHQWNVLEAGGGEFRLVDPDGLLCEPAYDMGVVMREDPAELMELADPRDRARWLAERTELDEDAIWEWGVLERVSTGLLCTSIDLQPVGRDMLAAADAIAER